MTLVSPTSLLLSTAPPRCPPEDVVYPLPHRINRLLSNTIFPVRTQNRLRDNGSLRSFVDGCVKVSASLMAVRNASAAMSFIRLSRQVKIVKYGEHCLQKIELLFPETNQVKGLVYFVHGGAWGSGSPWMYRLVSLPFLDMGLIVAIVGYRTYPDGNVENQVDDLLNASIALSNELKNSLKHRRDHDDGTWLGNIIVGHSSGAHIALLFIIRRLHMLLLQKETAISQGLEFDCYIGVSGVYSIHHHFDYESWRGVEEISPMKPACDFTLDAFKNHSPVLSLFRSLSSCSEADSSNMVSALPPLLLIHGSEDSTVPFTSSADAAYMLRYMGVQKCTEYYIAGAGHEDTIMDLMFGGVTREICSSFITSRANHVSSLDENCTFKSKL